MAGLSEFSLEYMTALLMNLSLRLEGKNKCAEIKEDVVAVLSRLLTHSSLQVRTFVNGTLYSIFFKKAIREHAIVAYFARRRTSSRSWRRPTSTRRRGS